VTLSKKPNLVEEGVSRLVSDFRTAEKPVITGILRTWLRAVKRLDDLAIDVIYAHILGTAVGVQLETIGKLLNEPRLGRLDAAYRLFLGSLIRAQTSRGRTLDTFEILELVLGAGDFSFEEPGYNSYAIEMVGYSSSVAETLQRLLRLAKPAGFNLVIFSTTAPQANVISYGSVTNALVGKGYGSTTTPALSRAFAHVKEVTR